MRMAAFSTPSFHPHVALQQLLITCTTPPLCCQPQRGLSGSSLTLGPKYIRGTVKGAAFCFIFVSQLSKKLYNMVLQHRYLVYKLLPRVCTVPSHQEGQPKIITILKPIWTLKNVSACRRILEL